MRHQIYFLAVGILVLMLNTAPLAEEIPLTQSYFNKLDTTWKDAISRDMHLQMSSSTGPYMALEPFQQIISYKVEALPFLFKILKQSGYGLYGACYQDAVHKISKKNYTDEERNEILRKNISFIDRDIAWWENEYESDVSRFNDLYKKYCSSSTADEKSTVLKEIEDLGIRILPDSIDELKKGDVTLIEVVNYFTDGEMESSLKFKDNPALSPAEKINLVLSWWNQNKRKYSLDYKKITTASCKNNMELK